MALRSLSLAAPALALALIAAPAHASVSDGYLPIAGAAEGVTVGARADGEQFLHFGPKAAKLYRTIGGRKAFVACGDVIAPTGGGTPINAGYGATEFKLPRKRSRVRLVYGGAGGRKDICTIANSRVKSDGLCIPNAAGERRCVRVIVALTDLGRTYLDARARAIDLFLVKDRLKFAYADEGPVVPQLRRMLGPDIVELATPDDSPLLGKVGVYVQGANYALAALLASGRRQFVRFDDPVYSTNVHEFIRGDDPEHTTFSVFL